mmetsp:Transcript_12113/g.18399  ORF Transcript_12113/g.18399 Transcript_12113/m.18399 type:complete len:568 (-) Transcript_12113:39-1742(-)
MISINASTTHTIKKKVVKKKVTAGTKKAGAAAKKKTSSSAKRGVAPPLQPNIFSDPEALKETCGLPDADFREKVNDILREALGAPALFGSSAGIAAPRKASSSIDRRAAAADLATLAKEKGVIFILKKCKVIEKIEMNLVPNGIAAVFGNEKGLNPGGGMRKITSAVSLASMGSMDTDHNDAASTIISDSKKGLTTPPEAREGCLLFLRALAQIVGKQAEPFVVPMLAAALEECSSSSSFVREAAEDTTNSILELANGLAVPILICPVLFEALHSPEWRVKASALEKLAQCASLHPTHISRLLPEIVPTVSSQVWDTKPQVTMAAKSALLACCNTNINPDVAPAIPAVVNAICKPNDTVKAIDELKSTTFVATVDASTLAILCPVLARGLKDKLAVNKRSTCLVVENMSRLVETPTAVAPFGPLLVPELKKVAENVQFEEIRDAALKALGALTKALGHSDIDSALSAIMKEESERIEAEQKRIEDERAAEAKREEEMRVKEEEEKKLWREAMEAQRQLNDLAIKEEEEKKAEEKRKKDIAKTKTKSAGGKCQGCGLKKCKKTCLFAK